MEEADVLLSDAATRTVLEPDLKVLKPLAGFWKTRERVKVRPNAAVAVAPTDAFFPMFWWRYL